MVAARLQLSHKDFNELTPVELYEAFKALNEAEYEHYKRDMEVMRLQTLHLINIQLKRDDRLTDPRQLMTFAWEDKLEEEVEILTEDEWSELDKKYSKAK